MTLHERVNSKKKMLSWGVREWEKESNNKKESKTITSLFYFCFIHWSPSLKKKKKRRKIFFYCKQHVAMMCKKETSTKRRREKQRGSATGHKTIQIWTRLLCNESQFTVMMTRFSIQGRRFFRLRSTFTQKQKKSFLAKINVYLNKHCDKNIYRKISNSKCSMEHSWNFFLFVIYSQKLLAFLSIFSKKLTHSWEIIYVSGINVYFLTIFEHGFMSILHCEDREKIHRSKNFLLWLFFIKIC